MGFGGLSIATSGLRVAQRNLNVTGHNISNSEVPGFSRQRIVQTTAFVRSVGVSNSGNRMIMGMGADWSEVHQIRNEFLDVNYRNNVAQLTFYSTKVQAGLAVETLLGELHGAFNFQTVLNNMWYAIQELTSHPEGLATRQFFLSNANTFLIKAQETFEGLVEYQFNLDAQIRDIVTGREGINATVAAIADLNQKIRFSEASGEKANDYRDERHRLLDHLAGIIPIDAFHAPNGDINITSMGHHLLTGTTQSMMGLRFIATEASFVEPVFTRETNILSAGTPPTEFTPYLNYLTPINAANRNDSGKLLALLQARGTSPANHLSASVSPPVNVATLQSLATVAAGAVAPGPGTFVSRLQDAVNAAPLGSALRADLEAALAHAERDPNRFIQRLVASGDPSDAALNAEILLEMQRDYQAQTHNHLAHMWSINNAMIPQVQMNLDRIVNSVVTMINDALTGNLRGEDGNLLFGAPPTDLNGQPGRPLFIRDIDVTLGTYVWPITDHENPNRANTVFTINNIRINPDFFEAGGHNHLALSLSGAPGDTDLLVALQRVWMSATGPYSVLIGERNFNVQDAYIRFTANIATEISEANSMVTTQTIQTDQAQNMRMAIKGVSMDEEMTAMLRFQFAFQAASRVFNVIDSMIDRIVNGTGRVGL
jgi:flagellar hook-associated protein 1 FlgK